MADANTTTHTSGTHGGLSASAVLEAHDRLGVIQSKLEYLKSMFYLLTESKEINHVPDHVRITVNAMERFVFSAMDEADSLESFIELARSGEARGM